MAAVEVLEDKLLSRGQVTSHKDVGLFKVVKKILLVHSFGNPAGTMIGRPLIVRLARWLLTLIVVSNRGIKISFLSACRSFGPASCPAGGRATDRLVCCSLGGSQIGVDESSANLRLGYIAVPRLLLLATAACIVLLRG